jgi:hypothetical protein
LVAQGLAPLRGAVEQSHAPDGRLRRPQVMRVNVIEKNGSDISNIARGLPTEVPRKRNEKIEVIFLKRIERVTDRGAAEPEYKEQLLIGHYYYIRHACIAQKSDCLSR